VKLTLQVSSRTESFSKEPVYHLRVQVRGSHTDLSDYFTMRVTKEEFDAMPPGHVFQGDLSLFNGGPVR
jgi:hypothetical protein